MKKTVVFLFVFLFITSCAKKISDSDISYINGYWQIEKVVFPDGNTKEYTNNESYDCFEIKNNKGTLKKVTPLLNGTFLANGIYENVEIKNINGKYYLYCSTFYTKWTEELLYVSKDELVRLSESKREYHYKRATPINVLTDGKKIK